MLLPKICCNIWNKNIQFILLPSNLTVYSHVVVAIMIWPENAWTCVSIEKTPSFLFQFILFSLSFDLRLSSSFSLVSLHIWSDHARQQQQTHETLLLPLQAQQKCRYSWWFPRAWEGNEQASDYIENLKWVILSTTFAVVVQHW